MQFKAQAGSQQVRILAYRGYDKAKKSAIVKQIGSYNTYTLDLSPPDLLSTLDEVEVKEITEHLEAKRKEGKARSDKYAFINALSSLESAGEASGDFTEAVSRLDAVRASAVWKIVGRLEKALAEGGFPRPKRAYKSKTKALAPNPTGGIITATAGSKV